jgi:hypothetical protein
LSDSGNFLAVEHITIGATSRCMLGVQAKSDRELESVWSEVDHYAVSHFFALLGSSIAFSWDCSAIAVGTLIMGYRTAIFVCSDPA